MLVKNDLGTKVLNKNSSDVKKIHSLIINNGKLGQLHTKTQIIDPTINSLTTKLINKNGRELGSETFILKSDNSSYGTHIEVAPAYRQKGYHLGEILRLSSIIMILENKIKSFEIFSLPEAIFFHKKYKFDPNIIDETTMKFFLTDTIDNCQKKKNFQDIYKEANYILNSSPKQKDQNNSPLDLINKTNELMKKYFDKVLNKKGEYKHHHFRFGLQMQLSQENILKNKDFFNKLFKKHKIDYVI